MKLYKKNMLCLFALITLIGAIADKSDIVIGDTSIVGVMPGDLSTYSYNVTLFSNETGVTLSTHPYFQWFSTIDTCSVLVENVSDTNVTALFTYTFKNSSTDTATRWVDVESSQASDSEAAKGYFIALNSTIYNETLTRSYLGVIREVGHIERELINGTISWWHNETEFSLICNFTFDYYMDKSTGTLLEYSETGSNKNGTYLSEMSTRVVITQSSIIPEFASSNVLLLFIIATLTIVLTFREKHRHIQISRIH